MKIDLLIKQKKKNNTHTYKAKLVTLVEGYPKAPFQ